MPRPNEARFDRFSRTDSSYSLEKERAPTPKPLGSEIISRPQNPSNASQTNEAGMRFLQLIREDRPLDGTAPKSHPPDLASVLTRLNRVMSVLPDLLESINNLPAPSDSRDDASNQILFPLAAARWIQHPPVGPAKLIHDLYVKTHTDPATSKVKLEAPDWIRASLRHLTIQQTAKNFPKPIEFIAQSEVVAPQLAELQAKLKETNERLEHLASSNAKTRARGKEALFEAQEEKARSDAQNINREIDALIEKVTDVAPEKVPAAAGAVQVKVALSPNLLSSLLKCTSQLERLIIQAVRGAAGKPIEAAELSAPGFGANGKADSSTALNTASIVALGRDTTALVGAIDTLTRCRESLRRIYATLPFCEDLAENGPEIFREAIGAPLLRHGTKLKGTLILLMQHQSPEVRSATARLLTPAISTDAKGDRWGYLFQELANFDLLTAATTQIIRSKPGPERDLLATMMCSSPTVEAAIYSNLKQCLSYIDKDDAAGLARFIDEQIVRHNQKRDTLADIGLLALLNEFSENEEWSFALRHQIPHLDQIKQIGNHVSTGDESLKKVAPELVHVIMRSLSQSLKDYYMDETGPELEELIENFRYFLSHPECLEGIPGNEGIRTAVALYGKPGVGKTFLVNCLKNELNLELFSLSAADKEDNQDRLDYTRSIIQRVKDHKKPCILLIDEAETTVVDRMSEHATSEDRDRTNYLLQEIDELRRLYPQVLIIIASNYPDRVDDALIRPGRVDLEFEMSPPSLKGRASIIDGTLKREKLSLLLSAEERRVLAEISDGFIPVQIVQTIIETNRLYLPRMKERDEDFKLTFEVLKSRFEAEARRLARHNERLLRKGSPFARKDAEQA